MPSPKHTRHVVDTSKIAKHFDSKEAEARWDEIWEQRGVHRYDETRGRNETFAVDTPPPTVSGSLHVGHVFSYTHTDVIVRFQRMRGRNIFYPMGWDDNGLPTERRVQNYFHVRCDPRLPYDPNLEVHEVSAKQLKEPARTISRRNFIELCHRVTQQDEKAFMSLWRRIGLSVDWRQEYATIDDRCRHLAQLSFRDLFDKGHVYSVEAPTMWDVDFQTAVAQAEVEDRETPGAYHHIRFGVDGADRSFTIATTRPELLAACVGVAAHPDDPRYRDLFGKFAITPLFHARVPIFPTELADPKKGTGILMVCTFGDATDVRWWREQKLALRQIVGRDGRLLPVTFGTPGWESGRPELANRYYGELAGKTVKAAQKRIVELLAEPDGAATGSDAPLTEPPKPIQHPVKYFEKGDRPLEIITTRQWFVRLMDKKEALIAKGDAIQWHPDFMRLRYRNWTENLQLDWCVSRQRFFGVSFPVWYPLDDAGQPSYDRPIVAAPETLPVDPMTDTAPGYDEAQRGIPGGFVGEADVFDTWFTSSLSPQIGTGWLLNKSRHGALFPMDLRPQSHEIIRTWAFYTIAKAFLHEDEIPWRNVAISGWILDPDRKKMSKSRGNVVTPMHLLDEYTSDGVRYWSASARLGTDTAFDENVLKLGKRLVTKVFNAGKFVLSQPAPLGPIACELDRSFVARVRNVIEESTKAFEDYDFARALMHTESFFWKDFTDAYLELTKSRARGDEGSEQQASAVATLRLTLQVTLRLFAPFLPFITEEVWSWAFADETGHPSIHTAPWPTVEELADVPASEHGWASFDAARTCYSVINKRKSELQASVGRTVRSLTLACAPSAKAVLMPVWSDVKAATRSENVEFVDENDLGESPFQVMAIEVAPKETNNITP